MGWDYGVQKGKQSHGGYIGRHTKLAGVGSHSDAGDK